MALRQILLKIAGDGDDAKREIADVAKAAADFGRVEAEATLAVDASKAETAIQRASRELREFGRISAEAAVDVDIAKATAQLEKIKARLVGYGKQPASVKVDAQTTKALLDLNRVQARLDKLSVGKTEVKVDVDRGLGGVFQIITAAVGGLTSALATAAAGAKGLLSGLPVVGNVLAGITGAAASILSLGPAGLLVLPIMAALAFALGGLLVQAAIGAAAALTALVAVIAGAVAGAAALGIAFAAIAAPVAILAVGAVAKLAKALLGSKDAAAKAQSATESLGQAQSAQAQAAASLADAQRNVSQQRAAALREERDAVAAVADAELARERAAQSRISSRLDLRQAREDLKNLRAETGTDTPELAPAFKKLTDVNIESKVPDALKGIKVTGKTAAGKSEEQQQIDLLRAIQRVRDAKTGIKAADQSVATTSTALADAIEKQNRFAREGPTAFEPYADALRSASKAQDSLRAATDRTAKAQRAGAKAQENLAGATTGIGGSIKSFTGTLQSTFGPAIDAIFKGAGEGLAEIARVLPQLRGSFTNLGSAIGEGFRTLGRLFSSPTFVASFRRFTDTAADLVRNVGTPAIANFSRLLVRIANVALPLLREGLTSLGRKFGVFTDGATKGDRIKRVVDAVYASFVSVVKFAAAVGRAIVAIFSAGQKPGQRLLDKLTQIINKFTNGLGKPKGRAALKKFFDDGVEFAGNMRDAVSDLIDLLKDLVEIAKDAKDVAKFLVGPGVTPEDLKKTLGKDDKKPQAQKGRAAQAIDRFRGSAGDLNRGGANGQARPEGAERDRALAFLRRLIAQIRADLRDSGLSRSEINRVIGRLPKVKGLAQGGLVTSSALRLFGEAGPEVVLPLTRRVFGDLAAAITAEMRLVSPQFVAPQLAFAGSAGGGGGGGRAGQTIERQEINVTTPGGGPPDPRALAVALARESARRR